MVHDNIFLLNYLKKDKIIKRLKFKGNEGQKIKKIVCQTRFNNQINKTNILIF